MYDLENHTLYDFSIHYRFIELFWSFYSACSVEISSSASPRFPWSVVRERWRNLLFHTNELCRATARPIASQPRDVSHSLSLLKRRTCLTDLFSGSWDHGMVECRGGRRRHGTIIGLGQFSLWILASVLNLLTYFFSCIRWGISHCFSTFICFTAQTQLYGIMEHIHSRIDVQNANKEMFYILFLFVCFPSSVLDQWVHQHSGHRSVSLRDRDLWKRWDYTQIYDDTTRQPATDHGLD